MANLMDEFEYVEIQSVMKLSTAEVASYLEPLHAIMTTHPEIKPEETVTTVICWIG